MGKKGSWFSAIKRVFTPHSKEKPVNDSEKKTSKEKKKKGLGKLRHGETNSFIPLFREPSSIEKIFGDFEREQQRRTLRTPLSPEQQPKTPPFVPPRVATPRASSPTAVSPRIASPRAPSPRVASPRVASPRAPSPRFASPRAISPRAPSPRIIHHHKEISYRPEPTLRHHHASATKIQAAYRGYTARRSFRALKGLVRLQGVVRGQNVKRQTMNAMKYMQLLVRVQSQIQSRRIQMLENQARRQAQNKEADSSFGKWNHASEGNDDWDDSVLTKEEVEARMQRKVEALVKRERAMAYAYSHQLWKGSPKSAQTPLADIRAGGFPWWYNWLERQLPPSNPPESTNVMKTFQLTPPRPNSELKPSPRPPSSSHKQRNFAFETMDTPTPRSTRSTILPATKPMQTPPPSRTPLANTLSLSKYSRPRASTGAESPFDLPLKDDDSLTSCPPFSVPNYMNPTVSAKAKARASSNPKERFMATPSSEKRRLSFPLTQGIGSFKWNKGSFFSSKDNSSGRVLDKHQSLHSVGNLSVDSTVSLPAAVGRKPFNRFV
ncbi:IQ motif, EF-hand binding site [Trema orientale]|uniref:IQ motif, EF-hand binding site n=1 Tax=Trema orientale TaxID=63057 RepID=A0A2P5FW64_TREOI|nr:IQ motif, EF-hand binding site [Trema orientale]